jgi:hypothetical protein
MGFSQTEQTTEVVVETQYGPRIVSDHQVVVSDVEPFRLPGHRNPRLAGWLSAAVPGAGQVYNGQWWKVPIIYGGATGLFFWGRFERTERDRFQDEYRWRLNNPLEQFRDSTLMMFNTDQVLMGRNFHRRNLELVYVFSALLYILNIVDAIVFAHLATFDVSDNLTMRVEPFALPDASFHALNNQRTPMQGGLRLTFTLK